MRLKSQKLISCRSSGRKGRDGQKKKIGKANERKEKVKRGKDEKVNGQGGKRGASAPRTKSYSLLAGCYCQRRPSSFIATNAYFTITWTAESRVDRGTVVRVPRPHVTMIFCSGIQSMDIEQRSGMLLQQKYSLCHSLTDSYVNSFSLSHCFTQSINQSTKSRLRHCERDKHSKGAKQENRNIKHRKTHQKT